MEQDKSNRLINEIKGIALGAAGAIPRHGARSFNAIRPYRQHLLLPGRVQQSRRACSAPRWPISSWRGFGLAAYLIPLALLYLAYRLLRFKAVRWKYYKFGRLSGASRLPGGPLRLQHRKDLVPRPAGPHRGALRLRYCRIPQEVPRHSGGAPPDPAGAGRLHHDPRPLFLYPLCRLVARGVQAEVAAPPGPGGAQERGGSR